MVSLNVGVFTDKIDIYLSEGNLFYAGKSPLGTPLIQ